MLAAGGSNDEAAVRMNDPTGTTPTIDFARFFELAVDVCVVTAPDGRFALVNPALARLLQVDREAILAGPWSTFVHPDDRERSAAEAAREFEHGHRTITFENRYVDASGGIHWMDWAAELDPETGLVYGIARDVTEQRAARGALEDAHAAAHEARAAAEAANLAKSEFLSRMSHELRTPLNAVLGFAQMLRMDDLSAEQLESVDQILAGGHRLLELIDEVLDISRIEIGAVTISVEPVPVADVVAAVMSLLGPLAADGVISVRSTIPDDDSLVVMADRQRLHQVLVNFLSNALKYTPSGTSVTIDARPAADGWLRVTVHDDGPGIPADLLGRLFNPFERIGAERTDIEGTGLGLAYSKALTERMGGRIGADSVVGRGSDFWVELPIAEPGADLVDGADHGSAGVAAEGLVGSILYIEDNPSNQRLVERILRRRPGVGLRTTMFGREGLDLARQERPDLVVLDMHLPDLSGEEVVAALRADAVTAAIPIVILSADATRRQVDRLLAAGVDAYLTKPVDVDAFLAVLDRHLIDAAGGE